MEIKTKYNIGDKMWAMDDDNGPTEFIIDSISVLKRSWQPSMEIYYMDDIEDMVCLEEETFPTKEELLKSL